MAALLGAALVLGAAMTVAQADDDEDEAQHRAFIAKHSNPKWLADCGACHIAYPPRFLAAEAWREIMAGLDRHFGSDASLDAETAREITVFLEENARRRKERLDASGKTPLRITETRWFRREHDEVARSVWNSPKVKSPANCSACHLQAESGDFSEHNINIP